MSRILIVTHQFVPHVSPRTTRWKLIVEELMSMGHKVTIVTGTQDDKKNNKFNTIFVGNSGSSNIVSNLRTKSNEINSRNVIKDKTFKLLKICYRFVVRNFAWPDYSMFWLISVFRDRKRINHDYDIIISVSLPFSSHIAAYIINKNLQKPWIMDIGDPFYLKTSAPENNRFLYGWLNKYYENKFYRLASQILFTHEDVKEVHEEEFDININKTIVGQPISKFDEDLFKKSTEYNYETEIIKFGYFGIFTNGVRVPTNFYKFLDFFTNYEMHWYVNPDSVEILKKENFEIDKNYFHSQVSRNEALNLMVSSFHCLVSVGNLNPNQIPSKVIEYIATGKPVIHYAEIDKDPVINISKQFNNLFIVTKDTDIELFKSKFYDYFKKVQYFDSDNFNNLYSAKALVNKLKLF
jgi:hypothetical protein